MRRPLDLDHERSFVLGPRPPYHFDANFHKPSHYPSSDNAWEPGTVWITMRWHGTRLGLRFRDVGSIDEPRIRLTVFSARPLREGFVQGLLPEIVWRFNFDQGISEFTERFARDEYIGPAIERWRGMKPIAANSVYETLMIYIALQNAVIRRSVQMTEALFDHFGRDVAFDRRVLSTFWTPQEMRLASEETLRSLKVGYRAKTFLRISEAFAAGSIDETALRARPKEEIEQEMDQLYGVGPASLGAEDHVSPPVRPAPRPGGADRAVLPHAISGLRAARVPLPLGGPLLAAGARAPRVAREGNPTMSRRRDLRGARSPLRRGQCHPFPGDETRHRPAAQRRTTTSSRRGLCRVLAIIQDSTPGG